jgi:hypothetical protein
MTWMAIKLFLGPFFSRLWSMVKGMHWYILAILILIAALTFQHFSHARHDRKQVAHIAKLDKALLAETAAHEVTKASVKLLAASILMQSERVVALGKEGEARIDAGRIALQARDMVRRRESSLEVRLDAPIPATAACATPQAVLESGI